MKYSTRRFLISIFIALGIHFTILLLATAFSDNIDEPKKYKPLTVEISFEQNNYKKTEDRNIKQKKEAVITKKKFKDSESQINAPANISDNSTNRDSSQGVNYSDATKARDFKPVQKKSSYAVEDPDDSLIESIKSNTSDTNLDAESLFGDEPISPNKEQGISSGVPVKTGIVESETQIENNKKEKSKGQEVQTEKSILNEDDFQEFDKKIASAGSTGKKNELPVKDESFNGNDSPGVSISFDDPANKRRLLVSTPPDIPDELRTNGKPKYVVVLDFYIDASGFISNISFKKNSTDSRIDAAVSETLRSWLFESASEGDTKKVKATLTYIIEIK